MARIDGIIILDSNGKPLITSHFPSHPPSYPSTHIDTFNHALKRSNQYISTSKDAELDSVLWVNSLSKEGGMGGAALCHVEKEGLRFLVPVSEEVNPLFGFAFLDSFLETLTEYLGEVTEINLKDNFDIVYMLIEEMLDEGHPMTMETNMLKEIVLPPTLMRKLLNVAGVSGIQTPTTAPFTAPIPWRKPGIRHSNNEIYFDIEETLDAIVDRRGNVVSRQIWGRINCNSRLSGNPDLLLSLSNPSILTNCAFHPCIRYNKWNKDRVLSFIPPDGRFKLLDYQVKDEVVTFKSIPVAVKASMTLQEGGGQFSLTLSSNLHSRPIEGIEISINLGESTTFVSATATGDRRSAEGSGGGMVVMGDAGGVGGGQWTFDPNTHVMKWSLSSLTALERSPTLTGSFTCPDGPPLPSPSFSVNFTIPHHSFSNFKVNQLKVLGDVMYKPFKGVKEGCKAGKVEVRW